MRGLLRSAAEAAESPWSRDDIDETSGRVNDPVPRQSFCGSLLQLPLSPVRAADPAEVSEVHDGVQPFSAARGTEAGKSGDNGEGDAHERLLRHRDEKGSFIAPMICESGSVGMRFVRSVPIRRRDIPTFAASHRLAN